MSPQRPSLGTEIGKRLVRLSIAVVGLLIARLVVAALPMLKGAPPIGDTGIHPLTLAKAIIDTVMFVALLRFGVGTSSLLRAGYPAFSDSGAILNLSLITAVVAIAYNSYGALVRPLLGESQELYGWLFLILGLAPLVGVVVLVSRNMDTITELVFRAGRGGTATLCCPSCGQLVEPGVKFCPHCGAATTPATITAGSKKKCSSCSADNAATAKFCKECGSPLAA